MLELESVVDQRVGAFPRIVAIVVDRAIVEPRIDYEGVTAVDAAC
jgi:hypothetical protein